MQSNSPLAIRVGIFFTIAVLIALGLSLQVGKGSIFKTQYELIANFRQASGVEPGTRVTLRGVPIGKVKSMDWNASIYRVQTVLQIENKYKIPKNATAKIQVSSLLGGNVINISVEQGPEQLAYLERGDAINTEETPSLDEVLATVSSLSTKTEKLITSLDANQAETLGKINAVIDENKGYIKTTSESFARVGPKVEVLADRMNEMTEFMKSGQGTIGALYANQDLFEKIKSFADTASDAAVKVKSGEGTLGALIYKDDVANEARTLMTDLQRAAQQVESAVGENREGFRSLIAALSDASPKFETTMNNFNEVSSKINRGDGTLGKLVNDPTLYNDAQRAVNQVGESFESGEEQGVFRSFLGLIFGALI